MPPAEKLRLPNPPAPPAAVVADPPVPPPAAPTKPKTVAMRNPETGKTADVHPDEVENWKATGWRVSQG